MNLKELEKLICEARKKGATDETSVFLPMDMSEFTGAWVPPCIEESGWSEMGLEELDDEEIEERKLLNKPIRTSNDFILVPCGFFDHEGKEKIQLN